MIVFADKNVVWLEVAMDDALGVSSVERFAKLEDNLKSFFQAEVALLP